MQNYDLTKVQRDPSGNVVVSQGYTVNPQYLSPEGYNAAVQFAGNKPAGGTSTATAPTTTSTPSPYTGFFGSGTGATPSAGLDPNSFTSLLGQVGKNLEYNNTLTANRQLLVKHLFDSPLTPDELSKLPTDIQNVVNSGDRNAVELQVRVLNDQIQGRGQTLDKSISDLTTGYSTAQTNAKNAMSQILAYAQSTGQPIDKVAKALAPIYGVNLTTQMMDNLQALGGAIKPLPGYSSAPGSAAGGLYGTATTSVSTALGVDPSLPLSSVIQTSGVDPLIDAIIKNEGSSPKGVMNNPGNIKYMSLPGQLNSGIKASDGGTFASYGTPEEGRKAIAELIQNAADGKSSAYGAAPTLGSFMDKYTNTGVDKMTQFQLTPDYPSADIANKVDPLTGLTPSAIYQDALTFAYEAKLPPVGLGSGKQATAIRTSVQNKAASILGAMGLNTIQAQAIYAANKKAVLDNTGRLARVESVTNSVVNQLPRLATLADKVKAEGIDITESDIQAGSAAVLRKFGSTTAAAYVELLQTVRADYAANNAALAGSRGGEFFARTGVEAIPIGLTGDQYNAIKDQMVMSTKNIRDGIGSEIQSLLSQVDGGASTTSSSTTDTSTFDNLFNKYGGK